MPVTLGVAALHLLVAADQSQVRQVSTRDEKERVALSQTEVVRLSLPTQEDVAAWASPGLRVSLGFGLDRFVGSGPAWSWTGPSVTLRPSLRLDQRWGLGVAMSYGSGPGGVRWSVTAEPTFTPWRQLAIGVGLGFAGLSVAKAGVRPAPPSVVSRELEEGEELGSCSGSALSSLVRVEYLFVVGPLFASGPFLQAQAQWTRCQSVGGPDDRESGRPVVMTQWWRHGGASVGWWLTWR
jgi:hypothetical protein